ncbi:MAG TPA: diacylglycerol kinase family protein [Thermodesulfobacteriota bacterium]|nr:diacylglycerol kinase family protein [Thermodesulfobacteriota bacterium]
MKRIEYLLIVNPVAGRGRTRKLLTSLRALLESKKIPNEVWFTSRRGEATELTRKAIAQGFTYIVSVGGDGTAHEIANALIGSSAVLGIIPAGGGNDFPKAVGVPLEIPRAVETLISGRRRRVDVGLLKGEYFINGLGIGLDGAVSHRYQQMKYLRGVPGYFWGAVYEAFAFKGFRVEIVTPDWKHNSIVLLTGASNGQSQGGNFKLAPEAKVDDGLLDIHVIQDMSPLKRFINIPKVLQGKHLSLKEVQIKRVPWVEITLDRHLPAHMDGEPFRLEPGTHRIEAVPGGLEVMCQAEG